MKDEKKYEFDVAFSFTQKDEGLAFQISDLIQDRFKSFIYSEQQKKLAGADGGKKFNEVFSEQSRLVVILYRNDWGKTPWTQIEETAIRNRGHENGYDFTTFVQLDLDAQMPKWLPKNRIYYNFDRWGIKGLAPVIEARVEEAGGEGRPETVADKAEKLKRLRLAEQSRNNFLNNLGLNAIANNEVFQIIEKLKQYKPTIEDPSTHLRLAFGERPNQMYEFGFYGFFLCFNWTGLYENDVKSAKLKISLYEKSGHEGLNYFEKIIKNNNYKIDIDLLGNIGWADFETSKNFVTTNILIDNWVNLFIDELGTRKKAGDRNFG